MPKNEEKSRVVTPVFRVTFPYVFAPQPPRVGFSDKPYYQVTALFDPRTYKDKEKERWADVVRLADEVSQSKFKKPYNKLPGNFKLPFHKAEEKEQYRGFEPGMIYVPFKSKFKPGIVAPDGKTPIEDAEAFYSGCYARASVTAFAFENVAKGISFWMQNLMFVRDGERLDGRVDAADDFGEFGDEAPADFNTDDLL